MSYLTSAGFETLPTFRSVSHSRFIQKQPHTPLAPCAGYAPARLRGWGGRMYNVGRVLNPADVSFRVSFRARASFKNNRTPRWYHAPDALPLDFGDGVVVCITSAGFKTLPTFRSAFRFALALHSKRTLHPTGTMRRMRSRSDSGMGFSSKYKEVKLFNSPISAGSAVNLLLRKFK